MAKTHADILVIGAGMAGLAAASQLQQNGKSVIVLEARDRIGGRLWTNYKWKDLPVDMGAAWIEGAGGKNPITKLAHKLKVKTVETDEENIYTYQADGKYFPDEDYEEIYEMYEEMLEEWDDAREDSEEDESIESFIRRYLKENDFSEKEKKLIWYYAKTEIEQSYAGDLSEISYMHWDADGGFGGETLFMAEGYGKLAEHLALDLDIRLNHTVQKIIYKEDVTVETSKGKFTAEQIIVTLPLGVKAKLEILTSLSRI